VKNPPILDKTWGVVYKFQSPMGRKIPRILPKKYQLPAARIPDRLAEKYPLKRETKKKRLKR
jgi:hypothetical protein